jgi:hypothetical protein
MGGSSRGRTENNVDRRIERVGAAGERLSALPQDGVALSETFKGRKVDTSALALKRIRRSL